MVVSSNNSSGSSNGSSCRVVRDGARTVKVRDAMNRKWLIGEGVEEDSKKVKVRSGKVIEGRVRVGKGIQGYDKGNGQR